MCLTSRKLNKNYSILPPKDCVFGGRVGRGFGEFENPREGFYTSKKILKYKNSGEGFSQGRVGRGFGQIWN